MGIPEGEGRKKGTEEIFEVKISENYPKLMTDTKPPTQKLREHHAGKCQKKKKNLYLAISYINFRKIK